MRDIVKLYRTLVGEALLALDLEEIVERTDIVWKVQRRLNILGRRIKGPVPKTPEQEQFDEVWGNLGFVRDEGDLESFILKVDEEVRALAETTDVPEQFIVQPDPKSGEAWKSVED